MKLSRGNFNAMGQKLFVLVSLAAPTPSSAAAFAIVSAVGEGTVTEPINPSRVHHESQ